MSIYAANTSVNVDKSKREIELILMRYGAEQFAYACSAKGATVGFRMRNRMIRLDLPLPGKDHESVALSPGGKLRCDAAIEKAWEQACRQKWRALALIIKAKLEAIESGITSFDEEFLAYTLLPNGQTVGAHTLPALAQAYETGETPALLPAAL